MVLLAIWMIKHVIGFGTISLSPAILFQQWAIGHIYDTIGLITHITLIGANLHLISRTK